jgi:hypothetical protein
MQRLRDIAFHPFVVIAPRRALRRQAIAYAQTSAYPCANAGQTRTRIHALDAARM